MQAKTGDLFECAEYMPPFVAASVTSLSAAISKSQDAAHEAARIWTWIAARGRLGATCDEVEIALSIPHQTASARIADMVRGRFSSHQLTRLVETRPTRTGRNAHVHIAG